MNNNIIILITITAVMLAFVFLSLLGQWLQRRRDAVNTFAAAADKINQRTHMATRTPLHVPQQRQHGRRHAR